MNFQSRINVASAVPGFEDVGFTLNKMTEGRRIKLRLALANSQDKLRDVLAEAHVAEQESDSFAAQTLLEKVKAIIEDEVTPAWVRWGLHSITGLIIDDVPATVDSLIELGPRELYNEIVFAIKREAGLTDTQQGESVLPGTSDAPVDGQTSNTNVASADDKGTI